MGSDNLGNHTATTNLDLGNNQITNVSKVIVGAGSSSNWGHINLPAGNSINAGGSIYSYNSICVQGNSGACNGTGGVVLGLVNTNANANITSAGNASLKGGHVYLGAAGAQDLYGDDGANLYFDSNHASTARLIMRDQSNNQFGSLYGSGSGSHFGLLDNDGHWAIQHTTDSNTNWRINNSERMRLTTSGLGLGSVSPASRLQIGSDATVSASNYITFGDRIAAAEGNTPYIGQDTYNGTANDLALGAHSGSGGINFYSGSTGGKFGTRQMRLNAGGDLSIGTDNASAALKLDVAGQIGATGYCDENGANCLTITNMGADNLGNHTATTNLAMANNQITALNRVTFNESAGHYVTTNVNGLVFNGGAGSADFLVYDGAQYAQTMYMGYNGTARLTSYDTNENLQIDANGTGFVDINDDVQIGNAITLSDANSTAGGPDILFDASSVIASEATMHFMMDSNNDSTNASIYFSKDDQDTGSDVILMEIQEDGNVGIGDTTPSAKLDVNGTIRSSGNHTINASSPTITLQDTDHYSGMIHQNSNLFYVLSGSGINATSWTQNANSRWPMYINMQTNGAVFGGNVNAISFTQASDVRLKKDISTIAGLDTIMQLRGVDFTWKESGKKSIGLIAQEVEKVLPEIVTETEITDPETGEVVRTEKAVEYANLVAPLIEAVKEQQAHIEKLEGRINPTRITKVI